jgi:predicted  nucleic acid-binding Zn-ribbon protein
VSNPEGRAEHADRQALQALETAVGQALERLEEFRARARVAESQRAELGELLRRFTDDEGEATLLLSRLRALEGENQELRGRLEKGREGVERLLARIRFLEGQR